MQTETKKKYNRHYVYNIELQKFLLFLLVKHPTLSHHTVNNFSVLPKLIESKCSQFVTGKAVDSNACILQHFLFI